MTLPVEKLRSALGGRYEVERELGAGGSATVWLARDAKHGRRVALKVLRPELAEAVGTRRFLQEIAVTARLQHPHILQLYDSGEIEGVPFFVTPYVEGESLRARLDREGALPVPEALEIARSVGGALQYAHDRGVLHRDIKPDNILLQAGQPLVADFGVALALAERDEDRLTGTRVAIGTPGYMSPEQLAGGEVDVRSDVYGLGVLLYEMLAGEPPFTGPTPSSLAARVLAGRPAPIRTRRPEASPALERALDRALATEPDARFPSVADFLGALGSAPPAPREARLGRGARVAVAAAALAGVALVVWLGARAVDARSDREWARTEAIPEVQRLLGEWRNDEAFHLASRALRHLPDDPTLHALADAATVETRLTSDPPGARVRYRAFGPSGDERPWTELGVTPLDSVLLPEQQLVVRFERAGYRPLELITVPVWGEVHGPMVDSSADDMVRIAEGTYDFGREPVAVDSFRIDRLEVTNAEFRAFVEAGGYRMPELWPAFTDGRDVVPLDAAVARLVDRTGRPGPAGWELSRPPEGRERHPVGGVSWFEAVAYCRWAGKELPTLYHWKHAGGVDPFDNILKLSNFGDEGSRPAGESGAVGFNGAVDMAGNVREWVWNETRGLRFILGGAWDSPEYMFSDNDAADPWDRSPTNGFRCASYAGPTPPALLEPVDETVFDFNGFRPVDDEEFSFFTRLYEYDPRALEPQVLAVDTADEWVYQRVDYTAAYDDQRVLARVFLPRNATPPFQTVVYFPGAAATVLSSSENTAETARLMFLPRSGRALVFPVLEGMYERRFTEPLAGPAARRRAVVRRVQDIMRTVDYIAERSDLDTDQLAYMGVSLGAEIATPIAMEKRFDALVLVGGALDPAWRGYVPEDVAPWNYISRVTTPTLLINGRRDYMHPYRETQVPFFDAIDVPDSDKRFVLLDAGHVPEWNDVIRHTLTWLDERLGVVGGR